MSGFGEYEDDDDFLSDEERQYSDDDYGDGMEAEQIELDEPYDPNYEPTEEEILEHAEVLGIDLKEDEDLLWIAREALKAPLPPGWKPCQDVQNNEVYYFNFETDESSWYHPCDQIYREKYDEEKKKKLARGGSKPAGGKRNIGGGVGSTLAASTSAAASTKPKSSSSFSSSTSKNIIETKGTSFGMVMDIDALSPAEDADEDGEDDEDIDEEIEEELSDGRWELDDDMAGGRMREDIGLPSASAQRSMLKGSPSDWGLSKSKGNDREAESDESEEDLATMRNQLKAKAAAEASKETIVGSAGAKTAAATAAAGKKDAGDDLRSELQAGLKLDAEKERLRKEQEKTLKDYESTLSKETEQKKAKLREAADKDIRALEKELAEAKSGKQAELDSALEAKKASAKTDHEQALAALKKSLEADLLAEKKKAEQKRKEAAEQTKSAFDAEKKRLQNTHNQEIEALKAKLADEKAKIDKSNAEALKNIRDEKERNHKKAADALRAELDKRHSAELASMRDEAEQLRKAEAAKKDIEVDISKQRSEAQSKLQADLAKERREQEDKLAAEMTKKRKDKEAALDKEIDELVKAHKTRLNDMRQKHRTAEEKLEKELRDDAERNRKKIQQEEEERLRKLHAEIQELQDACDTQKQDLESSVHKLKEDQNTQAKLLEKELAGIQAERAKAAEIKAKLDREVEEQQSTLDKLARRRRDEEARAEKAARRLKDKEAELERVQRALKDVGSSRHRQTTATRGGKKGRPSSGDNGDNVEEDDGPLKPAHLDGGEGDEAAAASGSELLSGNDSDDDTAGDMLGGGSSEAKYLQRAKHFLQREAENVAARRKHLAAKHREWVQDVGRAGRGDSSERRLLAKVKRLLDDEAGDLEDDVRRLDTSRRVIEMTEARLQRLGHREYPDDLSDEASDDLSGIDEELDRVIGNLTTRGGATHRAPTRSRVAFASELRSPLAAKWSGLLAEERRAPAAQAPPPASKVRRRVDAWMAEERRAADVLEEHGEWLRRFRSQLARSSDHSFDGFASARRRLPAAPAHNAVRPPGLRAPPHDFWSSKPMRLELDDNGEIQIVS